MQSHVPPCTCGITDHNHCYKIQLICIPKLYIANPKVKLISQKIYLYVFSLYFCAEQNVSQVNMKSWCFGKTQPATGKWNRISNIQLKYPQTTYFVASSPLRSSSLYLAFSLVKCISSSRILRQTDVTHTTTTTTQHKVSSYSVQSSELLSVLYSVLPCKPVQCTTILCSLGIIHTARLQSMSNVYSYTLNTHPPLSTAMYYSALSWLSSNL